MHRLTFGCLLGLSMVLAGCASPPPAMSAGSVASVTVAFCQGCGCRGGPGWRSHRTGQCVGWAQLTRECGNPPSPARCTKEN